MAFRTLEINNNAELHIKSNQLEVTTNEGVAMIPIEDIAVILMHGANIRLSSMDLSILTQNKIAIITADDKFLPTAVVLPFNGSSRQSLLMHAQVNYPKDEYQLIWKDVIIQKIMNQSRALAILGKDGSETVSSHLNYINNDNVDQIEAMAAKEYFAFYHEGINRRTEDPINSRLNYGYAVIRSTIARSLVSIGFHPTFGLHHNSQLNAFNLADDVIEPYRAMVDLVAHNNIGTNANLSFAERRAMTQTLYNACIVDGVKINVLSAIDIMCESLKSIILDNSSEKIKLPIILPIETVEGVTE